MKLLPLLAAMRISFSQALSVEISSRIGLLQLFSGYAVAIFALSSFWTAASVNTKAEAYRPSELVVYFVMTHVHLILSENRLTGHIGSAIRMGKLASYLLRPYPYLVHMLAGASASAFLRLFLLVPLIGLSCLFYSPLAEIFGNLDGRRWLLYASSIILALPAAWLGRVVVGLLAFDLTQIWGPELVFLAFCTAFAGESYPLDLMPSSLEAAISWTPAYYMAGFPTLILMGRVSEAEAFAGLVKGSVVMGLTILLMLWMWHRGTKKFEAVST